jgi:8-oxo-dGTP pyrophosphatase MutT (NUDIX family)
MKKAYGGIVINAFGQVLLREPAGHLEGVSWTFPKGKQKFGESPERTALREVYEETGVRAEIVAKISGSFDGPRTSSEYFLMRAVEETHQFDRETKSIAWTAWEEAGGLIMLTLRPKRRRRDLRALKLARALHEELKPPITTEPTL